MNLVLFILICSGLTNLLMYGGFLGWLRARVAWIKALFECSLCLGFHVGWIVFFAFWMSEVYLFRYFGTGAVLFGFLSAGTSYTLERLFGDNGLNINLPR